VVIHYIHHRDVLGGRERGGKNVCGSEKAVTKGFSFLIHFSL
jgi:hypothetical protein